MTTSTTSRPIPTVADLSPRDGLRALAHLRHGLSGILPILEHVHAQLGDIFQLTLPHFRPVVVASPALIRDILTTQRHQFLWRPEDDPVTRLLRRGILVTDGAEHDCLHAVIAPSSRRNHFLQRADAIIAATDRALDRWPSNGRILTLTEMRKIALLVFEEIYFSHTLSWEELNTLWTPILRALAYIGPGVWVVRGRAPNLPRAIQPLEAHLYALIARRRATPSPPDDLLTHLIQHLDDDDLVRDQMMTMLIAGHDTSTAHLAWTLWLLARHPDWLAEVVEDVRTVLGTEPPTPEKANALVRLDQTSKESIRLYPPIHVGNRFTAADITLGAYRIPAGTRVMVSIYLVHRHPAMWEAPHVFQPTRWQSDFRPQPFTYLPFGGGPRNCIGGAFAMLETRLILARILQRFDIEPTHQHVRPRMGATLEPHPDFYLTIRRRV